MPSRLNWSDEKHATINGFKLFASNSKDDYSSFKSNSNEFLVVKSRSMIETELALLPSAKRILELGIWQGGSAVLLDQWFAPEKLLTIDLNPVRIRALDDYAQSHPSVRAYYGVNQADTNSLCQIVDAEFPGQSLDLIIDDASHFYIETRASFLALFPKLRPGGLYLIEDWNWAHWEWEAHDSSSFLGQPSLLNLVVEIAALVAARPDIAQGINILPWLAVCRRGTTDVYSAHEMTKHFMSRGNPIRPTL